MVRYGRLLVRLGRWHPLVVLGAGFVAMQLLSEVFGLPGRLFPQWTAGGPDAAIAAMGLGRAGLDVVIIGPVFETALHQALPILALRRWTRLSAPWVMGLSALAFGAVHLPYNLLYGLSSAAIGGVLAFVYLARLRGNGGAFWLTFGIHAANNGMALLMLKLGP